LSFHQNHRGGLDDLPFSYRENKNGSVFIFWRGHRADTLTGKQARSFLSRIGGLDDHGRQLVMAKITGNFKRGNERADSGSKS
jgi:hypothetical protein